LQLVLALALLGVAFFGMNYAFALEDPYEVQSNRFTTKPTICVVAPGKDLQRSIAKSVMEESKTAIHDWITPLSEKSSNKDKWAINYLGISNKKLFDFSMCDVIINFKNESDSKTLHNLGTHQYVDGTSYITIYYKTNGCKTPISCKNDNSLMVTKIGSTLRHEFGHAIGLGHYHADKSENKEWFDHPETAPSIMLAYSKGIQHELVTPSDIDKVIDIYDNSGFTNRNLPKQRQTMPMAFTQIAPKDLLISDQIIKATKEIDTITLSGTFEKKNKLQIAEITIMRPDFKTEKIKTSVDSNGYFEHKFDVHSKLPKGIYYVQAKYGKDLTEKNTFEIN